MFFLNDDIFLIKKSTLAFGFLCTGILWAYWGALMPWFMWPTLKVNAIIACFFIILAFYVSFYFSEENIFNRTDYALPTSLTLFTLLLIRLINLNNVIGYMEAFLTAFIFFSIFKLDTNYLRRLVNIICISMGALLLISIPAFILYLIGFPLPSSSIAFEDMLYSYQNYYLFLIDDRVLFEIVPRFHSVFLEPGHLGTATTFLLLTQIGQWKKWYNIILIVATLITFSLAAYVLFIMVLFASAWVQHKQVIVKILGLFIFLIVVGISAFFYKQGDNVLFMRIVERLEMNDGKLSGDNRVTGEFEAVYEDFTKSNDIWTGREYKAEDFGFGNSGYRVFFYDNGLICIFFVILFYLSTVINCHDRRAAIAMLVIAAAAFWVRANPFSFYYFLPLYAVPFLRFYQESFVEDPSDD